MYRRTLFLMAFLLISCFFHAATVAEDWPQWLGVRRDGIWRDTGLVAAFPQDGPRVRWRVPVNMGYSGPSVADGRVFLMDRVEEKLAEDQATPRRGLQTLAGKERVLCIDEQTGDEIWTHEYECTYKISYPFGPRTTPTVDGERVYTLGAMGQLICFQAENGEVIWEKDLQAVYELNDNVPVWGFAAHPLVDGDQLICTVGGKGTGVVAFDKLTGAELWRGLTAKEICYAPPVIYESAGVRQLIVWHDVAVTSLDPSSGRRLWYEEFPEDEPQRPAVAIANPRLFDDGHLLVSDFYNGSLVLKISAQPPSAEVVWMSEGPTAQHKDTLNTLMAPAIVVGDHIYGMAGDGELRCLEAKTGKVRWRTPGPTGEERAIFATSFIVPADGRYYIFNDQGELVIANLSPEGYEELGRAKVLEPAGFARGRNIVWSHPAFANKRMYARNDDELICVELSATPSEQKR